MKLVKKDSTVLAMSDEAKNPVAATKNKSEAACKSNKYKIFGGGLDDWKISKKVSQCILLILFFLWQIFLAQKQEVIRMPSGLRHDVRVEEMSHFSHPSLETQIPSAPDNSSIPEARMCTSAEMRYLTSFPEVEEAVEGNYSSGFDHWMKVGKRAGLKYTCSTKSPRQLWINIMGFGEGLGAWRRTLSEVLHLAKELSATLVEPCMLNGRLKSSRGKGKQCNGVPISKVLDLSWSFLSSDDRPPLMASYEEYQNQLQKFQGKRTDHILCLHPHKDRTNDHTEGCEFEGAPLIEDILDTEQLTNIDIYSFWKDSMESLRGMLKIGPLPDPGQLHVLSFLPEHRHTVRKVLQSANISDDFSVIHWRAEKKRMDLMECAEAVLDTRRAMESIDSITNTDPHPFLLMSSLNEDPDMMWAPARDKLDTFTNTPKEALDVLVKKNGFIMFDSLLKAAKVKVEDRGMLAVYDLILASMSRNFATCAEEGSFGCSKQAINICEKCNHLGKFATLAIQLRKEAHKRREASFECWPTKDSSH